MIESKSEERGIFLKWSVFRDKETTLSEKVLFLEINNLSMLDKGCIASNSHFADTLGVKKEAISRLISSLEKKGYITAEIVVGSRNHKRTITINKMLSTNNKMLFRGKQNVIAPLTNCLETKENKTINKTINKTTNSSGVALVPFLESHNEAITTKDIFEDIIYYLNSNAGTNYKSSTPSTKSLINSRFKEGFSVDDFYYVIDNMCSRWLSDNKMRQYLRPTTIFGAKFESYLNCHKVDTRSLVDIAFDDMNDLTKILG